MEFVSIVLLLTSFVIAYFLGTSTNIECCREKIPTVNDGEYDSQFDLSNFSIEYDTHILRYFPKYKNKYYLGRAPDYPLRTYAERGCVLESKTKAGAINLAKKFIKLRNNPRIIQIAI